MARAFWTEADDGAALRILSKSTTLAGALAELSGVLGRRVTRDSLDARLGLMGLGTAHSNLSTVAAPAMVRVEESKTVAANPSNDGLKRVLFIPDCHVPYEDKRAFELMLNIGRAIRPDIIVCLGDLADFFQISDHDKGARDAHSLRAELHAVNHRLDQIDALGAAEKIYTLGNHEYRWNRHLAKNAPEFADLCDLKEFLHLKDRGWKVTDFHNFTRVGKLYLSHCLNNKTYGKNAHRAAQAKFASNFTGGHTHRMVVEYNGSVTGETWVSASFGWLGDRDSLAVKYAATADRYVDWTHGIGIGSMLPDGVVHVQAVPFINYTAIVDHKVFTAPLLHEIAEAA